MIKIVRHPSENICGGVKVYLKVTSLKVTSACKRAVLLPEYLPLKEIQMKKIKTILGSELGKKFAFRLSKHDAMFPINFCVKTSGNK